MKIGEAISRIKNTFKAVNQDAESLSDRYVYSLILKYGKVLMRREDMYNRIVSFNSIWKPSPSCIELIDVDKAKCGCLDTCTIKRTKDKLPKIVDGYYGPLIRNISSADYSQEVRLTTPLAFEKMTRQPNFKYSRTKYCWYDDGYLYFPNIEWDAIIYEAVFEESAMLSDSADIDYCADIRDSICPIPDFLFGEIEQMIMQLDLKTLLTVPIDVQHDKINVIQ